MKPEDQVTSPEISKQFKGLGVKQESLWYWCQYLDKRKKAFIITPEQRYENTGGYEEYYSAFTVAELGEMLPQWLDGKNLAIVKDDQGWWVGYEGKELKDEVAATARTEANARGKLLIHLIKNELIKTAGVAVK